MDFIAIVLCAGLGTRLRPLTHFVPKTVVPVGDSAVAYHAIRRLLQRGLEVVHCNTHYLAPYTEQEIKAHLRRDGYAENRVRFWYEPEILETGGGIANIVHTLSEESGGCLPPGIIVFNGDVYADDVLNLMLKRWESRTPQTCGLMVTRKLPQPRPDVAWVNTQTQCVVGFGKDIEVPTQFLEQRLFTTQQILSTQIVRDACISKESSRDLFYRAGLAKGLHILNTDYPVDYTWYDVGDYASLGQCQRKVHKGLSNLPQQCLIICSAADGMKQKETDRSYPIGDKSTGDLFRGFASKSQYTLNLVSLSQRAEVTPHLLTQPRLPGGSSFAEQAVALHTLCSPSEEFFSAAAPLSSDPGTPVLFFSLAGVGLPASHPLLLPLELLQSPLASLSPSVPLLPLYRSSQTFFIFS